MNWENSRALTPLKHDFLKAFFAKEKRFFLTGGSALGLFYLEHRCSYDLDLFVNKITTLISRCEIKDLVDLYFLEQEGMRIEKHFDEARQKDGGLDPAMISSILKSIQVNELPDYLIKPLAIDEFRAFVETLRKRMAILAFPDS